MDRIATLTGLSPGRIEHLVSALDETSQRGRPWEAEGRGIETTRCITGRQTRSSRCVADTDESSLTAGIEESRS